MIAHLAGPENALGAEDIRHRRAGSEDVLMRCLLSLDYVLEHADLPWPPTEPRRSAPSRLSASNAGSWTIGLPIWPCEDRDPKAGPIR